MAVLKERSHRPHSHPRRHTGEEEALIRKGLDRDYFRYGWEGAYMAAEDLHSKLKKHLDWSNRKPMRTLEHKSPVVLRREKLAAA